MSKKDFFKKYFIHIYMPFLTKTDVEWILAVKWQATGMIFLNSKHQPEFDPVRSRKVILLITSI